MTTSLSERDSPALGRYALWPLPELPRPSLAAFGVPEPPAPSLEERAYARGLEDGHREAMEEAGAGLKRAAGLLAAAAEALETARAAFLSELDDNLRVLALAVARQLVQREVATDPSIVRDLAQQALEQLPVGAHVEIHLHPEDLAALEAHHGLPSTSPRHKEIQWLPDPGVERGGCTVETPHRLVDGRVDVALRDLYQRIHDV